MSLAVTMKLANELSLLKSFLEMYRKFNVHLGGELLPFSFIYIYVPKHTRMIPPDAPHSLYALLTD